MDPDIATDDDAQQRELAHSLDCLTEAEHRLLTGWSIATIKARRKRGQGPPYIRLGKHYFYPRAAYQQYMFGRVRERSNAAARGAL